MDERTSFGIPTKHQCERSGEGRSAALTWPILLDREHLDHQCVAWRGALHKYRPGERVPWRSPLGLRVRHMQAAVLGWVQPEECHPVLSRDPAHVVGGGGLGRAVVPRAGVARCKWEHCAVARVGGLLRAAMGRLKSCGARLGRPLSWLP